jgi:hypothetical protein
MILAILRSKFQFRKLFTRNKLKTDYKTAYDYMVIQNVMGTFPGDEFAKFTKDWLPAKVRQNYDEFTSKRGMDKNLYKKKIEFTKVLAQPTGLQLHGHANRIGNKLI